jgi:fatty acid desaturase
MWKVLLSQAFNIEVGTTELKRIILHCFGKMYEKEGETGYIPPREFPKACLEARVYVLIFIAVITACIYMGSILPAMFIILPGFYGNGLVLLFGLLQHSGLYEDVLDHRLCTRTVYMNPFFRFLYWNMNYHMDHHMFPMVPYHALPALHKEILFDCPAPRRSVWEATKEVFSALRKQRKDPTFTIVKPLPDTARPYYYGPQPYGGVKQKTG